jgi:predicted DNA-binding protein
LRKPQTADKRKIGVHVSLDLETLGKLDAVAERVGLTRSRLLREMIDELLERDAEARWLADAATQELGEEGVRWEQAKQELGL